MVAGDAETQRQLHLWMAENHANQGQHANAAQSLRQARAIRDDQYVHYMLLNRLYHGGAKPPEIEPFSLTRPALAAPIDRASWLV